MILYLPEPIKSPYILIRIRDKNYKHVEKICQCEMCTITNRLRNEGKI